MEEDTLEKPLDTTSILSILSQFGVPTERRDELARRIKKMILDEIKPVVNTTHKTDAAEWIFNPDDYKHKPRYNERVNKSQSAIDFLREHWQAEIDAGKIFQFRLRKIDEPLLVAVRNYCKKRGLDSKDFIPIKSDFCRRVSQQVSDVITNNEGIKHLTTRKKKPTKKKEPSK